MLKKIFSAALLIAALQFGASAQSYKNALGVRMEFGSNYGTWFGFSGKHFFNSNGAGEAQLLFGSGITLLDLEYQYHLPIKNAQGLKWYVGFGPGFAFGGGETTVLLRPLAGLDYTLSQSPINFSFDWRPAIAVTGGSEFVAGRFGLAARYAF